MRLLVLAALTFSLAACTPDPWSGRSDAELCGGDALRTDLSPAPFEARDGGGSIPLPKRIARVGTPLSGAWSDFLDDTKLAEDAKAPVAIRFLDEAALADATRRCRPKMPAGDEAYALVVGDHDVSIAGSARGQARALSTLAEMIERAKDGELRKVSLFDAPAVEHRTVMEGFYGLAWDHDARLAAVRRAAALRMNGYLRAPKGDYLSTFLWFQPYPDDMLADAAELAAYAKARGVDFCWEVLPGGNVTYSNPAQATLLETKYDALYDAGVRCFVLAFDDSTKTLSDADAATGESFAELQVAFVRAVAGHLAAKKEPTSLAVVPNDYSTKMIDADPSTMAALAKLPASIELGWTGDDVVSTTVTTGDVARATELLGRPPALVDNYPVSDAGPTSGALRMLPVTGRDAAIFPKLAAYGGNAMSLARASFVALASLAELGWNPDAYVPSRAFERGVEVAAHGPNDALALFASQTDGLAPPAPDEWPPDFRSLVARYEADPKAGRPGHDGFVALLPGLRDVGVGIAKGDPALAKELLPWTDKARRWGQLALDLVSARDTYPPHAAPAEVVEALRSRLTALEADPAVYLDDAFDPFARDSIALLAAE